MAGAALLLVQGCGEDSEPDSSNRGSGSDTTGTAVENAHIVPQFVAGECAIQVGGIADLRFTATNNRTVGDERLLAVSTDAAKVVRMTPASGLMIEPGKRIAVGEPSTTPTAVAPQPPTVTLDGLDRDARPGTSVTVTFTFQRAGDMTMRVPLEACPASN